MSQRQVLTTEDLVLELRQTTEEIEPLHIDTSGGQGFVRRRRRPWQALTARAVVPKDDKRLRR